MKICLVCEGVASTEVAACTSCGRRLLALDELHFPVRRGEEDAAHPLLGALIDGKYRVAGVLGRGGMGTVFRAVHEVSLVPIALKLLHPRLAGRVEYRAHFLAEARKAGRVVHEHTARILDVGETQDGSIYIAQELVPGNTLHEWLQAGEPLPAEVLVEILRQVCSALVAAHAVGLVHRDLTPRNVMVEVRQGKAHARVLDFGIARGVAERAPGAGDEGLAAFASPPYAAPEHLAGLDVDGRADLYGLGVIAFEALCGHVPTRGSTAREFAAATLAGDLLPLAPRERVPRALSRLIGQLLAREPDARPASASAVLSALEAIGSPRHGRLRVMALAALLGATITFALAFRTAPPAPVLRLAPEQRLDLLPSMPRGTTVQALRSAALSSLRFDFGAFDPRRLSIEVWQNGEAVARESVQPRVRESSFLIEASQPAYRRLLDAVATLSEQGPVYLKFLVPGAPPLAYAALRIDDQPPELALALESGASDGSIRADTSLRIDVTERQLVKLNLEVTHAGNTNTLSLPLVHESRPLPASELIGHLFPPPLPVHDVTLQLRAEDAAGNVAASPALRCPGVDLGVPTVLRVVGTRGEGRTLLVGSNGVRLRVELSDSEPNLQLSFGPAGSEVAPCVDVAQAGTGVDATWALPAGAAAPADGSYQLVLRDVAGNEHTFTESFTFATRRLEPALSAMPPGAGSLAGSGHAAVAMGEVFTDGLPLALAFQCNPVYRPESVYLQRVEDTQPVADAAHLLQAGDGSVQIALGELADGRYRMTVRTRAVLDGDQQEAVYPLLVQRGPVTLRLPAVGNRRFLTQLTELGVLTLRDGVLGDGRGWSLWPGDGRWLRGNIWFGRVQPTAHNLPQRQRADDPLLPALPPWPGENVLGACLRDALDRPVRVLLDDTPAKALPGLVDEHRQPVLELARFWWHTEAPRPRSSEVRVEYGQAARLVVDCPLPYERDDALDLYVDTQPCRPKVFAPARDGGVSIEFELPFDRLLALARLNDLAPAEFAQGRVSEPFTLWLAAPDGRHPLIVHARTSRTTLEPVRLDTTAGTTLPASLRAVWMVPVLGPGLSRSWRDPVPERIAQRATLRTGPVLDLRSVDDFYLQQHEVTREQYAQVMAAIAPLAAQGVLPAGELIHAGDPLGAARLAIANLVPRAQRDTPNSWVEALAAEPTRAVAGIDFFQAYLFARAVGWLLARDPALFRLPSGVELELAALGAGHDPDVPDAPLNGAARTGGVRIAAAQAAATMRSTGRGWPPTAEELVAAGDRIASGFGTDITGLDFGVREWVADLPVLAGERARAAASSADHLRLLEAAADLGRTAASSDFERAAQRIGVVRGLALDELPRLHAEVGLGKGRYPPLVPGVVRVLQLARDGGGVLRGEIDPHLPSIGMRLCGGRRFLLWVRAK